MQSKLPHVARVARYMNIEGIISKLDSGREGDDGLEDRNRKLASHGRLHGVLCAREGGIVGWLGLRAFAKGESAAM